MVETISIEDLKTKLRDIFCAENKTKKNIRTYGYLTLMLILASCKYKNGL